MPSPALIPVDLPATAPSARATLHPTATSFACSRETRELGEDHAELGKIDRAYRLLERRLTRSALKLQARRSIATVTEFNLLLADARHDASWAATLALAKDAHAEARVVNIARAVAPSRNAT